MTWLLLLAHGKLNVWLESSRRSVAAGAEPLAAINDGAALGGAVGAMESTTTGRTTNASSSGVLLTVESAVAVRSAKEPARAVPRLSIGQLVGGAVERPRKSRYPRQRRRPPGPVARKVAIVVGATEPLPRRSRRCLHPQGRRKGSRRRCGVSFTGRDHSCTAAVEREGACRVSRRPGSARTRRTSARSVARSSG